MKTFNRNRPPDLTSGCYLVVARSGGKQYTGKLVVVK